MGILIKLVIGAAALAFVLAVVATVGVEGKVLGVTPEGYSRACSNLALLAIAGSLCCGKSSPAPDSSS